MSELALCSVIIPCYNCQTLITSTILSVLSQTYPSIEIIAIDDCSTDSTFLQISHLAKKYSKIKVLQNEHNLGAAETRNKAFQMAKGEFIALLDGDDLWQPDKLSLQIRELVNNGADICCCSYDMINAKGISLGKPFNVPTNLSFYQLLKQNFIGCSTAVFHRKIIESIQMRSEFAHEDYVFWLETMQAGFKVTAVRKPLVHYRLLHNSRSANKLKAAKNRWDIYRRFLNYNPVKSAYYFCWYTTHSIRKRILNINISI